MTIVVDYPPGGLGNYPIKMYGLNPQMKYLKYYDQL